MLEENQQIEVSGPKTKAPLLAITYEADLGLTTNKFRSTDVDNLTSHE